MSEAPRGPGFHESVFARLVAIMLVMAACLLGLVAGFYFLIVIPGIHASVGRLVGQYVRMTAAAAPDSAAAQRLATSLDLEVRYEGPSGAWSTSPDIPTIASLLHVRNPSWPRHLLIPGRAYYIVGAPQGGRYVFMRRFGEQIHAAHTKMVIVLLVLMAAVFATAYLVLKRALRPLRLLTVGVTQLSEGHLDVVVPRETRDEFGVLTDAFNHMARRVKEMVMARDQLLLDVSHELRSPLTRLKVALALLPDVPNQAGMAADLAEMERMVSELLELERLQDGQGIRTERQDLAPLLRDVVEEFRDRPPGVRLDARAAMPLDLDADRVRTVFRNLLENAIKYSLPGSQPIEITAALRGVDVIVRVADDGPGIPDAERLQVFEPFFRVDRSRSKKTGGYGLGLSICKRIVEAHGGTIAIEPGTGRGTTFLLTFPSVRNA